MSDDEYSFHYGVMSIEIMPPGRRMSASRRPEPAEEFAHGLNLRQLQIARETNADLETFARNLRRYARAK